MAAPARPSFGAPKWPKIRYNYHNIGQHADHGAIHRHPHLLRGAQHGIGRILKAEGRKAQRYQPEIRTACGNDRRVRGVKPITTPGKNMVKHISTSVTARQKLSPPP